LLFLKKELPWSWPINLQELNQTEKEAEGLQETPMLSLFSDQSLFFLIFRGIYSLHCFCYRTQKMIKLSSGFQTNDR